MLHQNAYLSFWILWVLAFWLSSGSRAYTAAGSFLHSLRINFGFETVKKLTRENTELDLKELVRKWERFLIESYPEKEDLISKALYRAPGVWNEICPHTKASLQRSAPSLD